MASPRCRRGLRQKPCLDSRIREAGQCSSQTLLTVFGTTAYLMRNSLSGTESLAGPFRRPRAELAVGLFLTVPMCIVFLRPQFTSSAPGIFCWPNLFLFSPLCAWRPRCWGPRSPCLSPLRTGPLSLWPCRRCGICVPSLNLPPHSHAAHTARRAARHALLRLRRALSRLGAACPWSWGFSSQSRLLLPAEVRVSGPGLRVQAWLPVGSRCSRPGLLPCPWAACGA